MTWNHTHLGLYVVAAVIVIAWIVMVIREMRRLK
jgi:hypothetical protein